MAKVQDVSTKFKEQKVRISGYLWTWGFNLYGTYVCWGVIVAFSKVTKLYMEFYAEFV